MTAIKPTATRVPTRAPARAAVTVSFMKDRKHAMTATESTPTPVSRRAERLLAHEVDARELAIRIGRGRDLLQRLVRDLAENEVANVLRYELDLIDRPAAERRQRETLRSPVAAVGTSTCPHPGAVSP